MPTLRFRYRDAEGHVSDREVENWIEQPEYFEGTCLRERARRTFRFDRVESWYDGTDALLGDAARKRRPRRYPRRHDDPEITFTGFDAATRAALEARARQAGLAVRASVTERLDFLCTGPNAGPAKTAHAKAVGAAILTLEAFEELVSEDTSPEETLEAPAPMTVESRGNQSESRGNQSESRRNQRSPEKRARIVLLGVFATGCAFVAGTIFGAAGSTRARPDDTAAAPVPPAGSPSTPAPATVAAGRHTPLMTPDGRLFSLSPDAVTCDSPAEVGLARSLYPRMSGSDDLTRAFNATRCLPPMSPAAGAAPVVYQLHHLEDVTWRASLDDGLTWMGGPIRVAELRQTSNGQDVILYVAADDLAPQTRAIDADSADPAATR